MKWKILSFVALLGLSLSSGALSPASARSNLDISIGPNGPSVQIDDPDVLRDRPLREDRHARDRADREAYDRAYSECSQEHHVGGHKFMECLNYRVEQYRERYR